MKKTPKKTPPAAVEMLCMSVFTRLERVNQRVVLTRAALKGLVGGETQDFELEDAADAALAALHEAHEELYWVLKLGRERLNIDAPDTDDEAAAKRAAA